MQTDVIIVGGGLNGCALAVALAGVGVDVALIDQQPTQDMQKAHFDGRCYVIAAAGATMLKTLGIWQDFQDHTAPIWDIKVHDGRVGEAPSRWGMHFDHTGLGTAPLGYVVQDRHLRVALLRAVKAAGVTHLTPCAVTAQQVGAGQVTVTLAPTLTTGDDISGAVLIGADGRGSGTAQRAGIRRMSWGYHQTSLVCALDHERPHNGIAHQLFLPAGPLAILPLLGNRSSIVWTEATDTAAAINALEDAAYLNILRPRFGNFLGDIALAGPRFTYPLGLVLAHRLTQGRVALVGDAAHGLHPIAGQGLNAGLRDVAALAQCIAGARRLGQDLSTALPAYDRWRRFDVARLAMATDGFNCLFSNDNPLLRGVRGLGLGLVNSAPSLKTTFMREAAGVHGDIPKLLAGDALL